MTDLDEVLADIHKNHRICPQPQWWLELYNMLPDKRETQDGWEPPLPLILSAWWDTPILAKLYRFREHIEWAASHGSLDEVNDFLCGLSEEKWYHGGIL